MASIGQWCWGMPFSTAILEISETRIFQAEA